MEFEVLPSRRSRRGANVGVQSSLSSAADPVPAAVELCACVGTRSLRTRVPGSWARAA